MRKTLAPIILFLLIFDINSNAQPPDRKITTDTISVGDTICFSDSISKYVVEFIRPDGKIVTMRGNTSCIAASSRFKSGTRIYVTELVAVNRSGVKTRLEKRSYYVK